MSGIPAMKSASRFAASFDAKSLDDPSVFPGRPRELAPNNGVSIAVRQVPLTGSSLPPPKNVDE